MRRPTETLVILALLTACPSGGGEETTLAEGEASADDIDSTTSEGDTSSPETSTTVEIPDCTPGAWGCECAEGGSCSPDLECIDGVCSFSECSAGWDGCPCTAEGTCDNGLFCVDGTCGCEPGSLGCDCVDDAECSNGTMCIDAECWLPSPYPNCGWIKASDYYFCGSTIAHPDFPIECPVPEAELVVDMPCPAGLTFEGCCAGTATYWCQNGVIATMAC